METTKTQVGQDTAKSPPGTTIEQPQRAHEQYGGTAGTQHKEFPLSVSGSPFSKRGQSEPPPV